MYRIIFLAHYIALLLVGFGKTSIDFSSLIQVIDL